MPVLYVLLISILVPHSLKSMERVEKGVMSLSKSLRPNHSAETIPSRDREPALKAAGKKKRQKSNSTNSPNPIRAERLAPIYETPIIKITELSNDPLIIAACKNDHVKIKFFLHNIFLNPNAVREHDSDNTPLHCAAMHNHVEAMNLLMADPRVNASEKNKYGKTARDLITITTDEDFLLRFKLFAAASLDLFVITQVKAMKSYYADGKTTLDDYKTAIQKIKNNFSAVKEKQIGDGEQELPKEAATLPPYADDIFIKAKLNFYFVHIK